MDNQWKAMLSVMIDESSLSDVEKKLAKERLKITADIEIGSLDKQKVLKDVFHMLQALPDTIQEAEHAMENFNTTILNALKTLEEFIRVKSAFSSAQDSMPIASSTSSSDSQKQDGNVFFDIAKKGLSIFTENFA